MNEPVSALRDTFVVEVGIRQAWPFITFCPADSSSTEVRLYIDTEFTVADRSYLRDGDADEALVGLLPIADLTVDGVSVSAGNALTITFSDDQVLMVSGVGTEHTSHDVWWIGTRASV